MEQIVNAKKQINIHKQNVLDGVINISKYRQGKADIDTDLEQKMADAIGGFITDGLFDEQDYTHTKGLVLKHRKVTINFKYELLHDKSPTFNGVFEAFVVGAVSDNLQFAPAYQEIQSFVGNRFNKNALIVMKAIRTYASRDKKIEEPRIVSFLFAPTVILEALHLYKNVTLA